MSSGLCTRHTLDPRNYSVPLLSPPAKSRQATQATSDLLIQALVTFDFRNENAGHVPIASTQTLSPAPCSYTLHPQTDTQVRTQPQWAPHLGQPHSHGTALVPYSPHSPQCQLFTWLLNMAKCSRATLCGRGKASRAPPSMGCRGGADAQHMPHFMAEQRQISLTFRNRTDQSGKSIKKEQTAQ